MASLSASTYNAISYQAVSSFTFDQTTQFRMLPVALNNAVGIDYVTASLIPTPDTLLNCARDTFNPSTLDLKPAQSRRSDCWPLSHTVQAVIPASYSGDTCDIYDR